MLYKDGDFTELGAFVYSILGVAFFFGFPWCFAHLMKFVMGL